MQQSPSASSYGLKNQRQMHSSYLKYQNIPEAHSKRDSVMTTDREFHHFLNSRSSSQCTQVAKEPVKIGTATNQSEVYSTPKKCKKDLSVEDLKQDFANTCVDKLDKIFLSGDKQEIKKELLPIILESFETKLKMQKLEEQVNLLTQRQNEPIKTDDKVTACVLSTSGESRGNSANKMTPRAVFYARKKKNFKSQEMKKKQTQAVYQSSWSKASVQQPVRPFSNTSRTPQYSSRPYFSNQKTMFALRQPQKQATNDWANKKEEPFQEDSLLLSPHKKVSSPRIFQYEQQQPSYPNLATLKTSSVFSSINSASTKSLNSKKAKQVKPQKLTKPFNTTAQSKAAQKNKKTLLKGQIEKKQLPSESQTQWGESSFSDSCHSGLQPMECQQSKPTLTQDYCTTLEQFPKTVSSIQNLSEKSQEMLITFDKDKDKTFQNSLFLQKRASGPQSCRSEPKLAPQSALKQEKPPAFVDSGTTAYFLAESSLNGPAKLLGMELNCSNKAIRHWQPAFQRELPVGERGLLVDLKEHVFLFGQEGTVKEMTQGKHILSTAVDLTSCSVTQLQNQSLLIFGGVYIKSGEIKPFCKQLTIHEGQISLLDARKNLVPLNPRSNHCLVQSLDESCLYLAGGYSSKGLPLKSVQRLKLKSKEPKWHSLPSMLEKRTNFQAISLNQNELIVMGGFNGSQTLGTVEKYDAILNEWRPLKPLKFARMDFGAFYHKQSSSIYVVGGLSANVQSNIVTAQDGANVMTNLSKVNIIEKYFLKTGEWQSCGSLPQDICVRSALLTHSIL